MRDDVKAALMAARWASYYDKMRKTIREYGMMVQGVAGNPPFNYTIGLFPTYGYEIFLGGVNMYSATDILNSVHASLKEGFVIEPGKIYETPNKWVNGPTKFMECHPRDRRLADEYVVQAYQYYDAEFPILQMVIPDRAGKFPEDEGFDHAYMDPRQVILYNRLH